MDLRCDSGIKHGDLSVEEGVLSVKCRSKRCGHSQGIIVIHRFNVQTGELISTNQYTDPIRRVNNAPGHCVSVRSA